MPQRQEGDAPRFSGHPDDLLWYLEDVRSLCMEAGCFEDRVWARWAIWYLGIDKFERWRSLLHAERDWADFVTDASRLYLQFRSPPARYSKYDLYNLVDEQKKVKIDSLEALLNYRLCFTKVATHLRVTDQLSSMEKDDLYLEGFDRGFRREILQRLEWNDRRRYADDPWPTCQVTREAEMLLEEGYRWESRQARYDRDQRRAREAQYEAVVQELRATRAQEECSERARPARPGMMASKFPCSTSFEPYPLTHDFQDSSMPLKVPEDGLRGRILEVDSVEVVAAGSSISSPVEGRHEASFDNLHITPMMGNELLMVELQGSCLHRKPEVQNEEELLGTKASVELEVKEAMGHVPAPQPKYSQSFPSPHTDIPPQTPHNKPQDAKDEPDTDERSDEAAVDALEADKPLPEPREDPCKVLQQAGSFENEEIESDAEIEARLKVVARRKPPEVKSRRKTLKTVTRRIKELLPGFWIAYCSGRSSNLASLLIYWWQGWTRSLGVETGATSPGEISQLTNQVRATLLRVKATRPLAFHNHDNTAMKIHASSSYESENYPLQGYEVHGGKVQCSDGEILMLQVKAPHTGGWSTTLESMATFSTRNPTKKAASRARTPGILSMRKQAPPCFEGEARMLREGPRSNHGPVHMYSTSRLCSVDLWFLYPRLYGVLHQVFEATRLGIEPK
ncbi:hypothetical protein EDD15DRAFT_2366951 [Pisolithus albus]|nr:hypothetical protein EDD15DRAFT_2366951 [Pisolithus albus]